MKKISHEVKIGATVLVTLLIFIWLYNFLQGEDLFNRTYKYHVVYDQVGGLAESSPVEVNGYKVGVVQSIRFIDPTSGRLLVTLSIDKGFKLPVNTVAEITTASLIAGMKIQFVYGNGPGSYQNGDTIPGRLAKSLLIQLEEELVPLKARISGLMNQLDSTISSVNDLLDPEFNRNVAGIVANLNSTTSALDEVVVSQKTDLKTTLGNLNTFSAMLADNSSKMGNTLSNLEQISDTLAAADLYTSMEKLKEGLENMSLTLKNLNDGKGSAGQLLTDDSLYSNLAGSLRSLDLLLQDMKDNPKKYVHFSLFGRKSNQ
ncbi:MAG: MlaD family protein [Bacteroidales bacterium]|jgi:phospholipid/cholesterol/gamma-HCH transport system substrate-binding protein|nr:MlaD family protein [Bacteroidales bacterium]